VALFYLINMMFVINMDYYLFKVNKDEIINL